jgi:hypothetical protein
MKRPDLLDLNGLDTPVIALTGGRHVGVELEFMGLSARQAASALAAALGGHVEKEDPHAFRIRATSLGDLRVETDLRAVHPRRHPELAFRLDDRSADWLGSLVAPFVPREVITGPLPFARLGEVDGLVRALRESGARGEGTVLFDTLGLHFNVDPPDLDTETLIRFLRAFLVLEPAIRDEVAAGDAWTLAALPAPFPEAYAKKVLARDYEPGRDAFVDDYLAANPTRRRALDLLPLLAHLDPERVRSALPQEKISPRPVFHYRLPLAHAGVAGWSILPAWGTWLRVEDLAGRPHELARRCSDAFAA